MKIEKNVVLPKDIENKYARGREYLKPTTQLLKDFINGNDNNICLEFDSVEELKREYMSMRRYHVYHKLKVVDFRLDKENNKLYVIRRNYNEHHKGNGKGIL